MLRKMMFILVCYGFMLPSHATDPTLPPAFTAHYKVFVAGLPVGKGTREFKQLPNGDYVFETRSRASGMVALLRDDNIVERSVFRYDNGQLKPLTYSYHHTGSKRERHVETTFDWETQQVGGTYKDQTWSLPLEAGVLDRHVYQIAFMRDLQQGGVREITYQIADKGKIKAYTPKLIGETQLDTGLGTLDTVKYERVSPSNPHRRTTIWLVPTLHYLPAQVEHVEKEDGEVIRMVLRKVEGLGK